MTEVSDKIIIEEQENKQVDDIEYVEIKDPYGFIYITTNLINFERYLGQRKFTQGWKYYLGSGKILKRAIAKYGKDNFKRDIIDIAYSEDELNQKEYEYSVFFDVVGSNNWYNLVLGGGATQGLKHTEEAKQKMSKAKKGKYTGSDNPNYGNHKLAGENNPNYGKPMSDEQKQKISDALSGENNPWYGKHHSEETKKKISDANRGRTHSDETKEILSEIAKERFEDPTNHPMYGTHRSEETKQKLSKSLKGKLAGENHPLYGKHRSQETKEKISSSMIGKYGGINSNNYSPVYCVELKEFFWGINEAQQKYGFSRQNITGNCMERQRYAGRHPITGDQLHWKYVYDKTRKDGTVILGAITLGYIAEQQFNDYINDLKDKGE